jgi:hypothetical protein
MRPSKRESEKKDFSEKMDEWESATKATPTLRTRKTSTPA